MSAAPPALPTLPGLPGTFALDTFTLSRGILHRIYWKGQDPLLPATDGKNRYDCPLIVPKANRFGVLYLGYQFETCWMETVVRESIIRPAGDPLRIRADNMTDRWACEVQVAGTLTIANFADEALLDLGESASNIMGDGYRGCTPKSQKISAAWGEPRIPAPQLRLRSPPHAPHAHRVGTANTAAIWPARLTSSECRYIEVVARDE